MTPQYNPAKQSLWYRQRNEAICADYERGMSVCDLVNKWHYTEGTIRKILRGYGAI